MNLIEQLNNFLTQTKDAREVKRALAVKLSLQKKSYQEVKEILQVSQGFISKWKNRAIFEGIESLKLQYKGRRSYLSPSETKAVIQWLKTQEYWNLEDLQIYLEREYKIIFESKQSYYDLFHLAQISWKKTQKKNPAKNEDLVAAKKKEIEAYLAEWQEDIDAENLTVFMIDECHLLWGDVQGYVWGKTNTRIEVPIKNQKERQTYYGALDYKTQEFLLQRYSAGHTENTIQFIKYLQSQRPRQRLAIFWDGASYHRSADFQNYLNSINQDLTQAQWQVICVRFAANAPEQNPVEDIWLQSKNFVRKFYHLCKSFKVVKWLFEFFAHGQIFDFPKLYNYAIFTQPI